MRRCGLESNFLCPLSPQKRVGERAGEINSLSTLLCGALLMEEVVDGGVGGRG